jgi:hypothetical protein
MQGDISSSPAAKNEKREIHKSELTVISVVGG